MKLKWKTILRTIFLMPVIPIIGAGGGDAGSSNTDPAKAGSTNNSDPNKDDQSSQNTGGQQEKTFTQAEVNAMMAKEKEQGRKSILKELGMEDVKNAKEGLENYKKYLESQKTDLEKAQDAAREAEKSRKALEAQMELSNQKFLALAAGCPAGKIDDVCVLARTRMSDNVTFEQALEQVKQGYPDMFTEQQNSSQNKGTGSNANPQNKGSAQNNGGLGQRLAALHKSENKNPYFNS